MGLDWLAGSKAKPGHERRFRELLEIIVAGETELSDAETAEWNEVGVPSYATVDAPRVGIDEPATAWFLERLRKNKSRSGSLGGLLAKLRRPPGAPTKEELEAIEKSRGYYVVELAPPCDGIPLYSHGGLYGGLELTSFRGAFLQDCEGVIGNELLESAYERKRPEDLVAYGQALMERANAWAKTHDCEWVRDEPTPPNDQNHPASRAHIVFAAARWCIYWGERGHWLDPWF